jgi:hypothetical protein
MRLKHYTKVFSKKILIIILSSLLFICFSNNVNAQINTVRNLDFGKISVSGPGFITISGDNQSNVSTGGGVMLLSGSPHSANLEVTFDGKYWYLSTTITYDSNITFINGSNSISFTPSPINGIIYSSPSRKKQNTGVLDIYLGGTLTIGSGIPGGTYTNKGITVFCNFNNN